MTLDERLQASIGQVDPDTPDVIAELRRVESRAARRRRHRRTAAALVIAVTGAVAVGVMVQARGDDRTEIGSMPATKRSPGVLVPSDLPSGLALVGVQPASGGLGSSGGGPPFSFTRTYAQFDADGSRVERWFQLDVGMGDENTEVYRTDFGDPIEIEGLPAKISGDESHSTLIWFDNAGRILRLVGDISRSEAIRIADDVAVDRGAPLRPRSAHVGELPDGFAHLFDVPNPRTTSFRGRTLLLYATPTRDMTLQIELQQHPSESVDEHLLFNNARVVDVRGHRGVFVDGLVSGGRELRWLEPGYGLVTLTGTTLSEDQLRAAAESLRPINNTTWKRLVRDVGTLGTSLPPSEAPQPTVQPLPPIGPEVVAAQGSIDDRRWNLTVYEVAPASGRTERRFCYELRGDQPAQQSCFPLQPDTPGWNWLYGEGHLGRWFLLGAAPHGAPSELAPSQGQPVPLQISEDPSLPIQVFVAVLPDPYDGTFSIRDQGWQTVNAAGPAAEGARLPFSVPGVPGVYPEFPTAPFLLENVGPAPTPTTPPSTNPDGDLRDGPAVQVLNGTGVNGLATARSSELANLGWAVLAPDNFPGDHRGNAVQCEDGRERVAKRLHKALGNLGTSASIEAIPRPRPPTYNARATCYVVLGK